MILLIISNILRIREAKKVMITVINTIKAPIPKPGPPYAYAGLIKTIVIKVIQTR